MVSITSKSRRPMAVRKADMAKVHARRRRPHPLVVGLFYVTAFAVAATYLVAVLVLPEAIVEFLRS